MTTNAQSPGRAIDESTSDRVLAPNLPAVLDLEHAAHLLGIGRTLAYELVRTDQWPTPVIRLGRLIKIPTAPLIDFMKTGSANHP
jgi:predicted DNA-binding transcriptional regulator AlpA